MRAAVAFTVPARRRARSAGRRERGEHNRHGRQLQLPSVAVRWSAGRVDSASPVGTGSFRIHPAQGDKLHLRRYWYPGIGSLRSDNILQPVQAAADGKYVVRACAGTACHVSGAKTIIETIEDKLGIEVGGTTEDGLFTFQTVACIGCCSLAPVIMVNDDTHGRLTPSSLRKLLRKYKRDEQRAAAQADIGCVDTAQGEV